MRPTTADLIELFTVAEYLRYRLTGTRYGVQALKNSEGPVQRFLSVYGDSPMREHARTLIAMDGSELREHRREFKVGDMQAESYLRILDDLWTYLDYVPGLVTMRAEMCEDLVPYLGTAWTASRLDLSPDGKVIPRWPLGGPSDERILAYSRRCELRNPQKVVKPVVGNARDSVGDAQQQRPVSSLNATRVRALQNVRRWLFKSLTDNGELSLCEARALLEGFKVALVDNWASWAENAHGIALQWVVPKERGASPKFSICAYAYPVGGS